MLTTATATAPAAEPVEDLRAETIKSHPSNPALQRLQARLLSSAEASEVITSYDRMHHRHSRS